MNTERVTGRAWGNLVTRRLLGITTAVALPLLTGCAASLADGTPEVIPYCADAVGTPSVAATSGCIPRP